MKVCAHINTGPYANHHKLFDSIGQALDYFRSEVMGNPYLPIEFDDSDYKSEYANYGVMDLYPACDHCTDTESWHDYPMRRYGIGRRGGLVRAHI